MSKKKKAKDGFFRTVFTGTWTDSKFRALTTDAQLLWLFLMTGPHTHNQLPGLYPIGAGAISDLMSESGEPWPTTRVTGALNALHDCGMVFHEKWPNAIYLPNALRYNPPDSANNIVGFINPLKDVPHGKAKDMFLLALQEHCKFRGVTDNEDYPATFNQVLKSCSGSTVAPLAAKPTKDDDRPHPLPEGVPYPLPDGVPHPLPGGVSDPVGDQQEHKQEHQQQHEKQQQQLEICPDTLHVSSPHALEAQTSVAISIPVRDGDEPILDDEITEWASLYGNVDVLQALKKMRGHWMAKPANQRKTRKGIRRSINTWLAKDHDRNTGTSSGAPLPGRDGRAQRTKEAGQRVIDELEGRK